MSINTRLEGESKMQKKIVALLLLISLLATLVGCKNTDGNKNDSNKVDNTNVNQGDNKDNSKKENSGPVSISFYPANGNLTSGTVGGWRGDYFKDEFGVSVEVWAYSDDKTNAILASGDLPDIMYVSADNLETMIDGGMVLSLDEHLDKIPSIQKSDDIQTALNYVREYKSAGTGKVYGIPSNIGAGQKKTDTDRYCLRLNWELYEKIGAPEVHNLDELIPVFKKMQEAEPVSETGVDMYAMNLFSDFDSSYFYNMFSIYSIFGYSTDNLAYLLETDMINGTYSSILEDSSLYYEGLTFMNKLYREGLLDPDSISYTRSQTQAIVHQQRSALAGWPASPGWAPYYYQYLLDDENIYYNVQNTFGSNIYLVVNAKTKNVDACLSFLEMMSNPDAFMTMRCGPEGSTWNKDSNGEVWVTENYINASITGETFTFPNGEEYVLWNTPFIIGPGTDISYTQNGQKLSTVQTSWPDYVEATINNEIYEKWKATMKYDSWLNLLEDKNALYRESELADVSTFAKTPDDTMQLMIDAIKDTVVTASWVMVYAETEAEFNAKWDEMVEKCEQLGAENIMQWRIDELEAAKEIKKSLTE